MAERINELQVLSVDQELALAIKNGDITKEEVERIWQNTTDLSANTPIATRKAVLLMKQAGSFEKAWPIFYKEVMRQNSEIMAAFNRDESKFAHLVAGTETIVKTLQNLNPLVERLDTMVRMMFDMKREIRELRAEKEEAQLAVATVEEPTVVERFDSGEEWIDRPGMTGNECQRCHTITFVSNKRLQEMVESGVCNYCGAGGPDPKPLKLIKGMGWMVAPHVEVGDEEQRAEQARKDSIGSAWVK